MSHIIDENRFSDLGSDETIEPLVTNSTNSTDSVLPASYSNHMIYAKEKSGTVWKLILKSLGTIVCIPSVNKPITYQKPGVITIC